MKREKKAQIAAAVLGVAAIAAGAHAASKSESRNMGLMREYYKLPKNTHVPSTGFHITEMEPFDRKGRPFARAPVTGVAPVHHIPTQDVTFSMTKKKEIQAVPKRTNKLDDPFWV